MIKKVDQGEKKFPETDKRILQGQAAKEGDVKKKPNRGGYKVEQESETEVCLMQTERVEEQTNCVQREFSLNGNFCGLLCC